MTDAEKVYEEWLSDPYFDEDTKRELRDIAGDEKEITDRFYRRRKGSRLLTIRGVCHRSSRWRRRSF